MKAGGRDFLPGNPGGPGRPKLTEEQKAIRESIKETLGTIILKYSSLSIDDMHTELKRQDLPALHAAVIKALVKAISSGEFGKYMDPLLDRTIGKTGQKIDLNVSKYENVNEERLLQLLQTAQQAIQQKLEIKTIELTKGNDYDRRDEDERTIAPTTQSGDATTKAGCSSTEL